MKKMDGYNTNTENSIPDRNLRSCPREGIFILDLVLLKKTWYYSEWKVFLSQKTWASFSSLFLVKVISIIFALGMPGFPYILYYILMIFFFNKHNNLVWGSWQMQFRYFPTESQEQIFFIFCWPVSKFFVYLKKKRDIFLGKEATIKQLHHMAPL